MRRPSRSCTRATRSATWRSTASVSGSGRRSWRFRPPTSPAQVVGHPDGLDPVRQLRQAVQVGRAEGIDRADVERYAVERDGELGAHRVKDAGRAPSGHQVVLADRLEPVDAERLAAQIGQYLRIVHRTE